MRARRAQARFVIAGAVAATLALAGCERDVPVAASPPRGASIQGAPLKAPAPEPAPSSEKPRDLQPKGKLARPDLAPPVKPGLGNPEGFSFDLLASYDYAEPAPAAGSGIPERVRAYEGERVTLVGYMLPIDFEQSGQVRGFFLMKDLASCCFGGAPRLNEFVDVKVPEGVDARYFPYEPVRVRGALKMGEARDGGRVSSLYQMTAELVRPDEE